MTSKQKFHHGDHVRIAKDLGPGRQFYQNDEDAIVIGSYADQYGGSNTRDYTVFIKDRGQVSWYDEQNLTLIARRQLDLLQSWKADLERVRAQESDLDWIFEHHADGSEPNGASCIALAACLDVTEDQMWGPRGEGIQFMYSCIAVHARAIPFLMRKDKVGWLQYCADAKQRKAQKP